MKNRTIVDPNCTVEEIMRQSGVVFDETRPRGFTSFEIINDDGTKGIITCCPVCEAVYCDTFSEEPPLFCSQCGQAFARSK